MYNAPDILFSDIDNFNINDVSLYRKGNKDNHLVDSAYTITPEGNRIDCNLYYISSSHVTTHFD
jgi:hypothetical protein